MDEDVQDEGLNYSGRLFGKPLDIYVSSDFGKPSLSYTIPSNPLIKYRSFLVDLSEKVGDGAMRLALGSYLPDHNNKKQIFQNVDLPDFSEVHDFLRRHIQAR